MLQVFAYRQISSGNYASRRIMLREYAAMGSTEWNKFLLLQFSEMFSPLFNLLYFAQLIIIKNV